MHLVKSDQSIKVVRAKIWNSLSNSIKNRCNNSHLSLQVTAALPKLNIEQTSVKHTRPCKIKTSVLFL